MESLWQDVRHAVRALAKAPSFTLVVVITLALGIGANAAVFSVLNSLMLRPLPVRDPASLVVLSSQHEGNESPHNISYLDYLDLKKHTEVLADASIYTFGFVGLSVNGQAERITITYAEGNYFTMLGVNALHGRALLPSEGQKPGADPVLVLGNRYWKRRFGGDPSIVGTRALVNGHPFTIVGVVPEWFKGTYSLAEFDAYLPLRMASLEPAYKDAFTRRDNHDFRAIARLARGVSLAQGQSVFTVVSQQLEQQYPDTNKTVRMRLHPENLARPEPEAGAQMPFISIVFMLMVGLVLLVACVNVVNLLLVRTSVRQRELAVRAALGAGRARLVRSLVTESVVLAIAGAAAGLVVGRVLSGLLGSIRLPGDLPFAFDFSFDWRVFGYISVLSVVAGLIVGLLPALRASRADLNDVLREGGRGSAQGGSRMRKALVVAQIAVSLILLIGAGLFTRSLGQAQQMDLGFDPRNVLNLSMDVAQQGYDEARGRTFYKEVLTRVRSVPGVISASYAYAVPFGYYNSSEYVNLEGQPPATDARRPAAGYNLVEPDYFSTMKVAVIRGRAFTETDDERGRPVAIVNEFMARKLWPGRDAVGQRFSFKGPDGPWMEVVGVVRDAKFTNLLADPEMYFLVPFAQHYNSLRVLQVRTAVPPRSVAVQIDRVVHGLDPNLPVYDVMTMEEGLQGGNGLFLIRMGAMFAGALGILGLVLASVGVYGVVSYAASQRTQEIGIRMALGAQSRDVLRLVVSQGLMLVLIGVVGGLVVAGVLSRFLSTLLFGISPGDPVTFLSVPLVLGLMALIACFVPAMRATRVNPVTALRRE
jgi:putative ABC transport system permease protein